MKKIVLASLLCILSLPPLSAKEKTEENEKIYPMLRVTSEVYSALNKRAFRNVDFPDAIKKGLKRTVEEADAHSTFFSPESYKRTIESATGQFAGIGISISNKPIDEPLVIIEALDGGPAEKAGLKSKDRIVEVDGTRLKGLSLDESVTLLKGKRGTKVNLKVIRDGKPLEFTVKRDMIKETTSAGYHFVDPHVYYLRLNQFAENSPKQVIKLIKKASKDKAHGLIIDLRTNPGGVLETAVDIAGAFLEKGSKVVITKNNVGEVVKEYVTVTKPVFKRNMPIFLLTNTFSASASEILAGALRHYSDIQKDKTKKNLLFFTLGTQTFGKGSVQEVFPISNGCALKLTTMLYFLPDDTSIQARGIEPDFLVKPKSTPEKELKWISELYGKETTLKGHITREEVENPGKAIEKKGIKKVAKTEEKEKTWSEKRLEALGKDVQIQSAINMINMLQLAKASAPHKVATRSDAVAFLKKHFVTDKAGKIEEVK